MPSNVWDEITYPFPNSNGCTVEEWEWRGNLIPHILLDVIIYYKLIVISKLKEAPGLSA